MREADIQINRVDWITVSIYFALVTIGWFNIYAAVYDSQVEKSIFDVSINSGIQLVWIGTAIVLITIIMVADSRFFENLSLVIYLIFMVLLILTPFVGKEVNGQTLSIGFGSFRIQPGEFAKFATALALAKVMERPTFDLSKKNYQLIAFGVLLLPVILIILQPDTGTAMVYFAMLLMFYREGLPSSYFVLGFGMIAVTLLALGVENNLYLAGAVIAITLILIFLGKRTWQRILAFSLIGLGLIAYIYSLDFVVSKLPPHQQNRIMVLFNPNLDPLGVGWNVTQSKIAIGSGGLLGKGYLEGTQTKFDFVPEQHTDFIFCTLGEEFGWIGSLVVISLFTGLLYRLIIMAERQKTRFTRIYGYCVVSILLFHFMINIAMTIGLFPVVGIPLPFFSYGGSSLWSFTVLLFIFIKMDSSRATQLGRLG
ncbi:rod shape-determining protein RodA [Algoriphagus sp.]|jgi:rod shape determining protein RodA|uniref:rod shape-determining protein RodA n=1 Tax=Algoriphagus sp. TaxID=1872435 RepID=UPI00271E45C1|nr:rod shape-determining protein RodA [Algoriphagus sp.]MDO8966629.1 rod shape-determining protein RodA [Algoriphagus sp.]MDP3202147.1 rod shape-determining protein RodA [Algoriphagus sp.]